MVLSKADLSDTKRSRLSLTTRLLPQAVLYREPRGSKQSRIISAFCAHNLTASGRNGKGATHNFFARLLRKQIPRGRHAAANNDHFRIEDVDDIRHRDTEINSGFSEHIEGERVAFDCC